ncbi:hypothetical protein EYF80_006580 [Liparis tanakae]|uniref:Uncharacterized protein n=1 Tax=Liparis tanakae TaxID=230148 RepID=A0A4Z2IZR2_9TELE|nr:hypothetical protein EYF80_006580 [Liparis tanakae]
MVIEEKGQDKHFLMRRIHALKDASVRRVRRRGALTKLFDTRGVALQATHVGRFKGAEFALEGLVVPVGETNWQYWQLYLSSRLNSAMAEWLLSWDRSPCMDMKTLSHWTHGWPPAANRCFSSPSDTVALAAATRAAAFPATALLSGSRVTAATAPPADAVEAKGGPISGDISGPISGDISGPITGDISGPITAAAGLSRTFALGNFCGFLFAQQLPPPLLPHGPLLKLLVVVQQMLRKNWERQELQLTGLEELGSRQTRHCPTEPSVHGRADSGQLQCDDVRALASGLLETAFETGLEDLGVDVGFGESTSAGDAGAMSQERGMR